MEHKVVSKKNEVFYIVRIYESDKMSPYSIHLLRAKLTYPNMANDKYPIAGVLRVENPNATSEARSIKKYAFKEYAVLLPIT